MLELSKKYVKTEFLRQMLDFSTTADGSYINIENINLIYSKVFPNQQLFIVMLIEY